MYTDALWYLSRGTGVMSLVLFSLVLALGIVTRSGREVAGLPRFAVTAVHRNASLLALVLLLIHVVGLLFDPYAQLRLVDVVVPFAGRYRPVWLGLGTLAFDLVVALVVTSLLRHRIGRRAFKAVHWTAYAMWPLAALHGLTNGTDSSRAWLVLIVVACTALVLATVIWRLTPAFAEYTRRRTRVPTVAPPGPPTTPVPLPQPRVPTRATAPPPPTRRTPGPVAPPPTYATPWNAPATPHHNPGSGAWNGRASVPGNGQGSTTWNAQPTSQPPSQPSAPWTGPVNGQRRDPSTGEPEGWR